MSQPEITYEALGELMQHVAQVNSEWAGIPLPVEGHPLTLEPRFPYQALGNIGKEQAEQSEQYRVVNSWFSRRRRGNVFVAQSGCGWDTRARAFLEPCNMMDFIVGTIGVSKAWSIDAELKASLKLSSLIETHSFRYYLLTGTFIESSKRSGVTYIFRKLRPTIALSTNGGATRFLCALCLHPIGYYERTWGGAMVPTDDVIAHLLLMRGDEHSFWKYSNQHSVWRPQSGI